MTTELDPKLRKFEAKLRQLKPLDVARHSRASGNPDNRLCSLDSRLRGNDGVFAHYWHRIAGYVLATTVTAVLVIVWFTPQPQPLPPHVEPTIVAVVAVPQSFPTTSPTMRQQLAALLDEMNVANPIAETKPVYPVVEIVVCDAPPKATVPVPRERVRFRGAEQALLMF